MNPLLLGIIHEYEAEVKSTVKMLEALKEEHKDWKPHEKSMTLGKLAEHIVVLQTWFQNSLGESAYDLQDAKPIEYSSFKELSDYLEKGVAENMQFVKDSNVDFWMESFTLKMGDHAILTLPRIAFLRSMLSNHLIHHRGQLSVYLRLLDIPVPGMYGPSADEK